jgi:hypothetical protein
MLVSDEDVRLFWTTILNDLSRFAARGRAEKWVAKNFIPHRRAHWRSLGGHKHEFERDSGEYLHMHDMKKAFEANGVLVRGDTVYARERKCNSADAVKLFTPAIRRSAKTAGRK